NARLDEVLADVEDGGISADQWPEEAVLNGRRWSIANGSHAARRHSLRRRFRTALRWGRSAAWSSSEASAAWRFCSRRFASPSPADIGRRGFGRGPTIPLPGKALSPAQPCTSTVPGTPPWACQRP